MDKKTADFYVRLKDELEDSTSWPSEYLYKFIVPTSKEKVDKIENAFQTNESKTVKYTGVSIQVVMENPTQVIPKNQELATIEGIISL